MTRSKKTKVLALGLGVLGLLLATLSWQSINRDAALQADLVETKGTVQKLVRERQEPVSEIMREMDRGEVQVTVSFDGHSKLFALDKEMPVGTEVSVLYQRGDPMNARLIEPGTYIGGEKQIAGTGGGTVGLAIGVILIVAAGGIWVRGR